MHTHGGDEDSRMNVSLECEHLAGLAPSPWSQSSSIQNISEAGYSSDDLSSINWHTFKDLIGTLGVQGGLV
jgi:hypothetical protein